MSYVLDKAVYIACCPKKKLTKIGVSQNPHSRMIGLSGAIKEKVVLYGHTRILENYAEIEKFLKNYFKEHRDHGEWFTVTPDEVEYVLVRLPHVISCVELLLLAGKTPEQIATTINYGFKSHKKYDLISIQKIQEIINIDTANIFDTEPYKYPRITKIFRATKQRKQSVLKKKPKYEKEYKICFDDVVMEFSCRYFKWINIKEWYEDKTRIMDENYHIIEN